MTRAAIWQWRGWTGAGPLWLNTGMLALIPFTSGPLPAQIAVITAMAALGGLFRHYWSGDYGHPAVHTAAALLGAAAVALVTV
ncbi:hypothetical protein [Streptomyces sp. NPDC048603]|uniref:hypothetical protein n=1 Tax=Streptomyces sp. NPDC048603 TaxID=3365577 RepID=UPI0037118938